jgi:hypothetical protein
VVYQWSQWQEGWAVVANQSCGQGYIPQQEMLEVRQECVKYKHFTALTDDCNHMH